MAAPAWLAAAALLVAPSPRIARDDSRSRSRLAVVPAAMMLAVALLAGPVAAAPPGHGNAAAPATAAPAAVMVAAAPRPANGPLTAAELAQQERIAQAASLWQAELAAVDATAQAQGNTALAEVIAQITSQLQQAAAAPPTVAGFLLTVQASSNALSLWAAHAPFASSEQQAAGSAADGGAESLTTAEETGSVLVADLASGRTWTYSAAGGAGDAGEGGDGAESDAGQGSGTADGGASGEVPADAVSTPAEDGGLGAAMAGASSGTPEEAPVPAVDADGAVVPESPTSGGGAPGAGSGQAGPLGGEAAAELGAPEVPLTAALAGSTSGWIVIHGGDAGSGQATAEEGAGEAGAEEGAGDVMAVTLPLGDVSTDPDLTEAAAAGLEAPAAPAAGEDEGGSIVTDLAQICRPWQPTPPAAICSLATPASPPL
jgi:hypothetical protein